MRLDFSIGRGRVVPGKGGQVAAFFVSVEVESEQMDVAEQAELTQRLTVRFAQVIDEEFGGEEVPIRRQE